ncbi:MAG: hypothetical protein CBC48_01155 [bacterium TMED88]|nr:hypothetical protein [Deltaproteobacteria bacterium]OUV37102.1 MAG: hypothetical protein CBC48_01155 [bacterium TMED88]
MPHTLSHVVVSRALRSSSMMPRLIAFLRLELALTPERWRAIGRIVIACAISITMVMTLRIPEGTWVLLSALIVSMPGTDVSLARCIHRLLAIAVGCAVSIGIVIMFPQAPWIQLPMIALVMGGGIYMSRTSAAPSVPLLGALTMILSIPGVVDVGSPESIHRALWRLVEIGAGNIIGTACQAFIWPERPNELLMKGLSTSLRYSKQRINQALLPISQVTTDPQILATNEERIMNSLALWTNWLDHATHSSREIRSHQDGLMNLIGATNQIAVASQQVARITAAIAQRGHALDMPSDIAELMLQVEERCELYATAIESQHWSSAIDNLPPLANALIQHISDDQGAVPTEKDSERIENAQASILSSTISVAQALDSMHDDVDFLRPEANRTGVRTRSPGFLREETTFRTASFTQIRRVDLVSSSKGALAGILAYIYLNAIDWPGGITAVVTAVLVCLDNYGAMILKSALRIIGAFIGGFLSLLVILFVIPQITTLPAFLVATGLVFGLGAWAQTGSARISYAGFQVCFAATLCLIVSHSPSVDLLPFRDRMLGIFTGLTFVVVVYGIFGEIRARVWAVDNCAETLRLLSRAATLGFRDMEPSRQETPPMGFRYELFRRIAFGYKLLTESSYEDWFAQDKQKTAEESEGLRLILDRIRAIHRVTLSLLWNRLDFQRRTRLDRPGRPEVEDVGRIVPATFRAFATRVDQVNQADSTARPALDSFSAKLRMAESTLKNNPLAENASEEDKETHRLLHSQVGFYRQLEILLGQLEDDADRLQIGTDRFSILARLRGTRRQPDAPHIRPV